MEGFDTSGQCLGSLHQHDAGRLARSLAGRVDVYELDMVSLDHFSPILSLTGFYLCRFGQQFYIKVKGELYLFSLYMGTVSESQSSWMTYPPTASAHSR